jgi:hypothetical protein
MENSYYQFAQQILKNEKSKHYNMFLIDEEEEQEKFNNEKFQHVLNLLKEKYQVTYKLFGEKNFTIISFEYFKYNPIQSSSSVNYGKTFSDFLGSVEELNDIRYVRWIAKLDWFWFTQTDYSGSVNLPKGTLHSWGNIYKDQNQIDINIDECIIEKLQIKKVGKEFTIVVV